MLFGGLLLLAICFILVPFGLIQTPTGKLALFQRAWDISNKGVDNGNQAEAIDILLRLTTDHYEGSKITGVYPWFAAYLVVTVGATVLGVFLGVFCPRSVIGMGLGVRKFKRHQLIGKLANLLLGVWFIAILSSLLGSWCYDIVKGLFHVTTPH